MAVGMKRKLNEYLNSALTPRFLFTIFHLKKKWSV